MNASGSTQTEVDEPAGGVGMRVMTAVAAIAVVMAASVIWLAVTQPVRVAGVMADGQVRSLAFALMSVVAGFGRALLAWL